MPGTEDLVELARVWRGQTLESIHHGAVAVADCAGRIRHARGDISWAPPPRSALKPFQAVALIESGAADALGLTDEHIALACASHHAQPFQVALVVDWLGKLGLGEDALVCGPDLPRDPADMASAFAHGGPRRFFHNCSGKHCGFLSVAKHLGAGLDYASWDHPAQRLYRDVLAEFTGIPADAMEHATDGCGLPAIALPMRDMARAAAKFSTGSAATEARRRAVQRVLAAMAAHPDHLSFKDSPTARLIRYTEGWTVLKGGAEGYLLGFVRDRGLGIAIKVADGDPNGRVKFGVLARVLGRMGVMGLQESELLASALGTAVTDSNGQDVGRVEITYEGPITPTPTKATLRFWLSGTPIEDWADVLSPLDKWR
jgi:L-asparaginase II